MSLLNTVEVLYTTPQPILLGRGNVLSDDNARFGDVFVAVAFRKNPVAAGRIEDGTNSKLTSLA